MVNREGWWTRLKYVYWRAVPYEWRPFQIWYRVKCRLWKRYSTVKPRWLGHTWVDRDTLLAHLMFEVLGQYLEREAGPPTPAETSPDEYADRWADNRRELRELWRWWTEEYLPFDSHDYLAGIEAPKMEVENRPDGTASVYPVYTSDEARAKSNSAHLDRAKAEHEMGAELTRRLHRLVDARKGLWT